MTKKKGPTFEVRVQAANFKPFWFHGHLGDDDKLLSLPAALLLDTVLGRYSFDMRGLSVTMDRSL